MDGLVEFLRARYDEEEKAAHLAGDLGRWEQGGEAPDDDLTAVYQGQYGSTLIQCHRPADARHIARHDPHHVLADIEAKREVLKLYEATASLRDHGNDRAEIEHITLRDVLRALSGPYESHPDYQKAWRF